MATDANITTTIVLAVISSGAISALINVGSQWLTKLYDDKKKREEEKNKKDEQYHLKQEEVYTISIEWLLMVRMGFDFSFEEGCKWPEIKKKYTDKQDKYSAISGALRIYSTDDIFGLFYHLNWFQRYAFSRSKQLSEDDKNLFGNQVNLLANLMKLDLGYRDYDNNPRQVVCPTCNRQHDYLKTCKCGLTFNELLKLQKQMLLQAEQMEENKIEEENVVKAENVADGVRETQGANPKDVKG